MTLSEAIKNLVEAKGLNILKSPIALNILNDYNAFREFPASKNILKNMICEGYLEKIAFFYDNQLPLGDVPQTYLSELYIKLGFRHDISIYVLNSIFEALGYSTNIMLAEDTNDSNQYYPQSSAVSKTATPQHFDSLSKKEQEKHLFSLVEYNETFCQRRNLKIEILELRITGKRSIEIDFEVVGTPQTEISFEYSLFDQNKENGGAIECWRHSKHEFHNNRLFKTAEIGVNYPLSEITQIRIKLDEDWD